MARKEQDGRRESKSRAAIRQSARGSAASAPAEPVKTVAVPRGKLKTRSGCVVASCICASEYQDARYGKSMRVFNLGPSGGKCAVCGAKRSV